MSTPYRWIVWTALVYFAVASLGHGGWDGVLLYAMGVWLGRETTK